VIPLAPQPVADPKTPALPAVRQLQVVVVPERELPVPGVEPDKPPAGEMEGAFGLVPPQPDINNPSTTARLGPPTRNNLANGFIIILSIDGKAVAAHKRISGRDVAETSGVR
jgi:hypothetical protein